MTLVWGVIKGCIADDNILDHTIVVGAYAQWLVSNSGKKSGYGSQGYGY